jgi:hypothetical protein
MRVGSATEGGYGGAHLKLDDVVCVDAALVDEAALGALPELALMRGWMSMSKTPLLRLLQACCS